MTAWIVIGIVVVLFLLFMIRANSRLIKIAEPTVGFLNLLGESGAQLVAEDRNAVRGSFYSVAESTDIVPQCDVLLLYAAALADGSLVGTSLGLRQIISDSGAKIVVVATDNTVDCYTAALKSDGEKANLVLTLDRREWRFPHFMKELFAAMEEGISMPVAWVRLAPQKQGEEHEDYPATVFSCELGHIAFKRFS